LIGENIELKVDLKDRDLIILADVGQIEPVLMNLATNARGAVTVPLDELMIQIDVFCFKGKCSSDTHGGKEGKYALLSVSDTGIGMDEAARMRIFEPFFRTKEVGKGTGCGLSMVYGIVKQHEGYIAATSRPGIGTTFRIYLPLVQSQALDIAVTEPRETRRGTETMLVSEDDAVRNLVVTLLTESGYTVMISSDGEQAREVFLENKDRIRLLLLDLIMPKMNGKEALDAKRKIPPTIKELFMSGYTADILEKRNIREEGVNLLTKPISPTTFFKRVREASDI